MYVSRTGRRPRADSSPVVGDEVLDPRCAERTHGLPVTAVAARVLLCASTMVGPLYALDHSGRCVGLPTSRDSEQRRCAAPR